jgi:ribosome-binding factor A
MSDKKRLNRYADLIKRSVGNIIETKLEDPHKGFITLTRVKVSPDLKIATIYYTVLGDQEQRDMSKMVLKRSTGFIRNELKPYITSRWLPELRFFYDDSQDNADRINQLLKQIEHDTRNSEDDS